MDDIYILPSDHRAAAAISSVLVDRFLGLFVLFAMALLALAGSYELVDPQWRIFIAAVFVGSLVAVALVRPSKDIRDVTRIRSVKKKWKDRSFAAAVNREEIEQACQALPVDLWTEHVPLVLEAMKEIAPELGLAGQDSA